MDNHQRRGGVFDGLTLLLGILLFLLCRRAKSETTRSEETARLGGVVHPAWEFSEDQVTQTNPMAPSEERSYEGADDSGGDLRLELRGMGIGLE